MKKKVMIYVLAVLACLGVVVLYFVTGALLEWEHGGGTFVLAILFGIISIVWYSITRFVRKE